MRDFFYPAFKKYKGCLLCRPVDNKSRVRYSNNQGNSLISMESEIAVKSTACYRGGTESIYLISKNNCEVVMILC